MRPVNSQHTDPEPAVGDDGHPGANRRSVVKSALKGLKGWQVVPAIVIALYLFFGIFGPILAPFEPNKGTIADRLCPPLAIDALTTAQYPASRSTDCSTANILGTDHNGKDIFSRMLHGARTSFLVVGPSVIIGVVVGAVVGAVINGWRARARMVAYLIVGVSIVPFAIFLLSEPHTLYVFGLFMSASDGMDWSALTAFSSASGVVTLALIAVAYRYDDVCRSGWSANVNADFPIHSFCRKLHTQIVVLAPWIVLATIGSAALIFLRSGTTSLQTAAIRWAYEPDYLFEHIGMLGPFVPMVLIPIALVSLATWWVVHHLLGRFKSNSIPTPSADYDVEVDSEENSTGNSGAIEEDSARSKIQTFENEAPETSIDAELSLKRQRWLLTIVTIVTAIVVIRFGIAEAVPIVRELAQDWTGDYQSALAHSIQGRQEAIECANELSSRLRTLRSLPAEQPEINAGQRCLDLYFQHRNAPTHRFTFDSALQFVPQTLTLALLGAIVSAAIWTATLASTNTPRRVVGICFALVALIGLTMTFGYPAWLLVASRWFDTVDLALNYKGLAISRAVNIVRDFSVALGISYLTIAIAKPLIRFERAMPKIDILSKWATLFIPCILLSSGLLILFHYRFPANLLLFDDYLGVIADPSEDQTYFSTGLPIRNWIWTYWFALIGYAAIVFSFFAAAIWGFRRYVRSDLNGVDSTPVNPDNPSQVASPTG